MSKNQQTIRESFEAALGLSGSGERAKVVWRQRGAFQSISLAGGLCRELRFVEDEDGGWSSCLYQDMSAASHTLYLGQPECEAAAKVFDLKPTGAI